MLHRSVFKDLMASMLTALCTMRVNQAEGDPTYFELEYTQGTSCDLTGQLRATTVQFICGEAADQFVSIKEDRSCHYKAVISTPRLCRHPAFAKELPSSQKITCEPQVVE